MKTTRFIVALLIVALLYYSYKLLWPAHYNAQELVKRSDTRYWELNTGSTIAYTFLAARDSAMMPYPVIYLHGGPGAGITRREIETFSMLADSGYNVYLYDQLGCGNSERLDNIEEYTSERHRRDLQEIISTIGAEKVVLVAQSWGSILALDLLAKNPTIVDRLIITAPAPIQPANKKLELIQAPDSLAFSMPPYTYKEAMKKSRDMRSDLVYRLARKYNIKIAGDKEADAFATYFTTELNKGMVCDTSKAVIAEGTEGLYVHYMTTKSLATMKDQRKLLSTLITPVLVMKAQCDNQLWGYTTEYLDIFRNHQLVYIKGAGHNIFLEQPALYVKTIVDFLKK